MSHNANAATRSSVLVVTAREARCALPLEHVIETMRLLPITPVAKSPPYVLGVAIIRGMPLPVVDLGALMKPDTPSPGCLARMVTMRVGVRQVAMAVETVVGVRIVEAGMLQDLPPLLAGTTAMTSLGALDRELLSVFDVSRVLSDEVWAASL